jgi:hypothetical protein
MCKRKYFDENRNFCCSKGFFLRFFVKPKEGVFYEFFDTPPGKGFKA